MSFYIWVECTHLSALEKPPLALGGLEIFLRRVGQTSPYYLVLSLKPRLEVFFDFYLPLKHWHYAVVTGEQWKLERFCFL